MSQWERPRVIRRPVRRADDPYLDDVLPHQQVGSIWASDHPWEWDDETLAAMGQELLDRLKRKRPPGFAPWPVEEQ